MKGITLKDYEAVYNRIEDQTERLFLVWLSVTRCIRIRL